MSTASVLPCGDILLTATHIDLLPASFHSTLKTRLYRRQMTLSSAYTRAFSPGISLAQFALPRTLRLEPLASTPPHRIIVRTSQLEGPKALVPAENSARKGLISGQRPRLYLWISAEEMVRSLGETFDSIQPDMTRSTKFVI